MGKREKAFQLKEEARKLEYEAADEEEREQRRKEEIYQETQNIDIYSSDDYAGLDAGKYHFYFGYEETMCLVKSHKEDCEDNGCEKRE